MDGSNTAIVRVFQEGTGMEREQGQGLFTKKSLTSSIPPGKAPVAHDDSPTLLGIYTQVIG